MGVRAALPLVVGIAIMLVASGGARAESLERPVLTAGDYWTYATNLTVAGVLFLEGRLTSRVDGQETTDVDGRATDVYRVVLNGSGSARATLALPAGSLNVSADWLLTGEDFLETTQEKTVRSLYELDVMQKGSSQLLFQVQNTTTYGILDDGWRYPLAPGATGSVTMAYNVSQTIYSSLFNTTVFTGNGTWTVAFSMDAAESVSVPAGVFPAYPIVESWPDGSTSRSLFSANVGNDVRTETFNETHVLTSTSELLAYRYQAAEPPTFLGLSLVGWAIVAAAIVAAAVAVTVYVRRKKKTRPSPPLEGPGLSP